MVGRLRVALLMIPAYRGPVQAGPVPYCSLRSVATVLQGTRDLRLDKHHLASRLTLAPLLALSSWYM